MPGFGDLVAVDVVGVLNDAIFSAVTSPTIADSGPGPGMAGGLPDIPGCRVHGRLYELRP